MLWRKCLSSRSDLPPPTPRSGHVAVAVRSEQWATEFVVIYGGLSDNKEFLDDVVVLETGECTWMRPMPGSSGGKSPGPRAFHAACAIGSRVFVFGGSWSPRNRHQSDVWVLDTDDWQWTVMQTSNQPVPRDFPTMVHVGGGLLALFGGYSGTKFMSDVHVLDIATATWREAQPEGFGAQQPAPRSGHAAAVVANRLAVFGGESFSNSMLADLWTLRGLQGDGPLRWTKLSFKGHAPTARGAHAIADMGTKLVVMGGHGEEGFLQRRSVYHGDVFVLDREPETGPMWIKEEFQGDVPAGRAYHSFTALSGRRMLLFGGCNGTQRATFGDAWWLIMEGSPHWEEERVRGTEVRANIKDVGRVGSGGTGLVSEGSGRMGGSPAMPDVPPLALSSPGSADRWQPQLEDAPSPVTSSQDTGGLPTDVIAPRGPRQPLPWERNRDEAHEVQRAMERANAMEELRGMLGLPRQSRAEQRAEPSANHAILALGRRELTKRTGAAPPSSAHKECLQVARQYLSQATPSSLRFSELDALLADYKSMATVALTSHVKDIASLSAFATAGSLAGRFAHARVQQLRLSEVPALLDDYRYLMALNASNTAVSQ